MCWLVGYERAVVELGGRMSNLGERAVDSPQAKARRPGEEVEGEENRRRVHAMGVGEGGGIRADRVLLNLVDVLKDDAGDEASLSSDQALVNLYRGTRIR